MLQDVDSDGNGASDRRDRYRVIYEQAGVGIEKVSRDGRLIEVNEALCRMLGYSREELLTLTFRDLTHPDDLEADEENMRKLFSGEVESYETEKRYRRKDGSPVWVHLTASAVSDVSGEPNSCVAVVKEITARKRAEEALLSAQRRKNRFFAVLAHELRNPLAAIKSAVRLLEPGRSAEHQQWARNLIDRQVSYLANLIEELLDVSRISEGKIRLRKELVDVSRIISRAVETAGGLIEQRQHQLDVAITAGPLRVEADPLRLEQVLVNLLNNAAKYTPEGGGIWLSVDREGRDLVFRVRDNGIGIDSDTLPNIFNLFIQGDESFEHSEGGLGIGLALVRRLVELHGGSVEAYSEGPGKGSEFRVRLPAVERYTATPPGEFSRW